VIHSAVTDNLFVGQKSDKSVQLWRGTGLPVCRIPHIRIYGDKIVNSRGCTTKMEEIPSGEKTLPTTCFGKLNEIRKAMNLDYGVK
jgi:hypothetical protein